MDAGLALKHGELRVEFVDLRLQGEHVVDECVDFVFIERRGRINSGAKIAERRLARIVRDLKFARGSAGNKAQPRRIAEQRRHIAEEFALFGVIVKRVETRRRVFNPQSVPIAAQGCEILRVADGAAIVEARRDRLAAAAIDADAAGRRGKGSAGDVDDAGGPQTILGRQSAGEQGQPADETRVQDGAKARDALGQHEAVDPVLDIGVFVAHMEARIGDGGVI